MRYYTFDKYTKRVFVPDRFPQVPSRHTSPDETTLYFNDVAGHGTEGSVTSPVVVQALVLVEGAQQ